MAKKPKYKQPNRKIRMCNLICIIFMCLGIASATYCLHSLMPMYGDYQYENRLNHLAIPEITQPTMVEIQVRYVNKEPTDITVTNGDRYVQNVEIEHINAEKTIFIRFDTDIPSSEYALSLLPQDNYRLEYEILQLPSIQYLIYDVDFYTDAQGDKWMSFSASYPRTEDTINCFIKYQGERYAPTIYDAKLTQGEKICINISEITRVKNINVDICNEIQIALSVNSKIDPEGSDHHNNIIMASEMITMQLDEWPAYDAETHHDYLLTHTIDYLSTLNNYHTQTQEEETTEETISENNVETQ